jgi:hypothetical protein
LVAASQTTKAVLLDENNRILRSWYGSNEGNPVQTVLNILKEIDNSGLRIRNSCVTGYGEYLLRAALGADISEVETLCHYRAARFFVPDVSFILDIGGQDIKCLSITDGQLIISCSNGLKNCKGANNNLVSLIEKEGGEAVVPNILDFVLYCLTSDEYRKRYTRVPFLSALTSKLAVCQYAQYTGNGTDTEVSESPCERNNGAYRANRNGTLSADT